MAGSLGCSGASGRALADCAGTGDRLPVAVAVPGTQAIGEHDTLLSVGTVGPRLSRGPASVLPSLPGRLPEGRVDVLGLDARREPQRATRPRARSESSRTPTGIGRISLIARKEPMLEPPR